MSLIIVESPTKARTFNRILKGKDYFVFATMGHIRDLPGKEIAIDFEKNFKPKYEVITKKQKIVTQLKALAKKNKDIILATDPDREGESISYHVAYLLGFVREKWPNITLLRQEHLKRIVFHEITPRALTEALKNPSVLRIDLVKAQQARRILDRVVGYELSPLLWKKTGKNWLSAGRVQTVALRLIVEREKEIRSFAKSTYFQIYGDFTSSIKLRAKLIKKDAIPYETTTILKLFAGDYSFTGTLITAELAETIKKEITLDNFTISEVSEEIKKRYPPPPFSTSLLQQEGFYKFGFSSKMVMKLAQDLYEKGLITYHRTDSFNLSTPFVFAAKKYIEETYGKAYALEKPRGYRTKSKLAQEAHEAIRPTKLNAKLGEKLTTNHKKLYQLIFDRAVSTQMKEAEIKLIKVHIVSQKKYEFESEFQQVVFDGFLKVLNPEFVAKNIKPVTIKKNESIKLDTLEVKEQMTLPPPRYNEGTLIRILEERGIGRPSTYAPIISLIQDKGYVEKDGRYFVPTPLGEPISDYLAKSFPTLFDINFTASMEEGLDDIANNGKELLSLLTDFYGPFSKQVQDQNKSKELITIKEETTEKCVKCGKGLIIRYSRFGKFYACSGYPECKFIKPFLKFIPNKFCPTCGGRLVVRFTKTKKRFYGCEKYPDCKYSTWKFQ